MKKVLTAAVVLASCALTLSAQNTTYSSSATGTEIASAALVAAPAVFSSSYDAGFAQVSSAPIPAKQYKAPKSPSTDIPFRPLSRVALGTGVSILDGIDFVAATNIQTWMNLRVTGHWMSYTYGSPITTSSISITPSINLKSIQASLDLMPFPKHSNFHISPGILFGAENNVTAKVTVPIAQTITFDNTSYTVTGTVAGNFKVNLSPNSTAATIGIGFGNLLPRRGSHWSVPFDIGAAFVGAPTAKFNLVSGTVCQQGTANCQPVSSFTQFQQQLAIEEGKINNDLSPLQAYPIVSLGVAYNFTIR